MEYDSNIKRNKIPSILQSNEMFSSKILARKSTVNSNSSRFYNRAEEGVPFKWERRPGKPISTKTEDHVVMPPLSPPPALLAMGLPKPCMNFIDGPKPKPRKWSSAWLVKKIKKIKLEGYYNFR
ncbi:hypothetical protein RND81_08G042800 [Saponaria officinalis]|uniref:Uncharacterized protein n=1 Tax=Saponaria officinalis TaxID=3572 RepID=A0AAW1J3M0_SAPOF